MLALCGKDEGKGLWNRMGMNGKVEDGDLVKTLIARDFILILKCSRKRLAAGLRPDPRGSLSAPPDPLIAVGAMEGNIPYCTSDSRVTMQLLVLSS